MPPKDEPLPGQHTIIRFATVQRKTGLGPSSIYNLIGAGEFPKPIPLSTRRVGWLLSEIDAWVAHRIARREEKTSVKRKRVRREDVEASNAR